jgi:hypothetical protein
MRGFLIIAIAVVPFVYLIGAIVLAALAKLFG